MDGCEVQYRLVGAGEWQQALNTTFDGSICDRVRGTSGYSFTAVRSQYNAWKDSEWISFLRRGTYEFRLRAWSYTQESYLPGAATQPGASIAGQWSKVITQQILRKTSGS